MTMHQVVLIPGDGIGPEVTEAVKRIFRPPRPQSSGWNIRPDWRP